MLTAGVGRADITPPVGSRLQGYMLRIEPSVGVSAPLHATALVLASATTKVAIVDCDLIGFDVALADRVRGEVAAAIGTDVGHVLLAGTHTHNGPPTAASLVGAGLGSEDERALERAYRETLRGTIVGIARVADAARRPARLAAGSGSAPLAINRREVRPDGSVILGQNPGGPTDHELGVTRVDGADGRPLAAVLNYAAHPVILGPEPRLIDPDYPGVARAVVERETGATALFLLGAAGNQMPIEAWSRDPALVRKWGGVIGCEAARVFHTIETRRMRIRTELVRSLAEVMVYHREEEPGEAPAALGAAERRLALPLRALPSTDEAAATLAARERAVATARAEGSARAVFIAEIQAAWARMVAEKARSGVARETREAPIQALLLGDAALVTAPGEPFVEMGLEAKARSPVRRTFYVGYANGLIGYIPIPSAYAQGGMEVDITRVSYGLPAALDPTCAGLIVDAGLELLGGLLTGTG